MPKGITLAVAFSLSLWLMIAMIVIFGVFIYQAYADSFFCFNEHICVSKESYGKGIYRLRADGNMALLKIECSTATMRVKADSEDWTDQVPINNSSIASALYEASCGQSIGEHS